MPCSFLSSMTAVGTGASSPPGPKDPADGWTISLQLHLGEQNHSQSKVQLLSERSSAPFSLYLSQGNLLGPFCYCPSHSATHGSLGRCLTPSPQHQVIVTESFLLTAGMPLPTFACIGFLSTSLLSRKLTAALGHLGGYHIFFHWIKSTA